MRINRPYVIDGYDKHFRIFNRIFWYLQRDTESKIDIQSDYWVVYKVVYTIYYELTSGTDFHQTVIFAVAPGRGHQDYFKSIRNRLQVY